MRVAVDGPDGRVASDRPDDELIGEPVVGLRFKLVFKLRDVVAVEGIGQDILEDPQSSRGPWPLAGSASGSETVPPQIREQVLVQALQRVLERVRQRAIEQVRQQVLEPVLPRVLRRLPRLRPPVLCFRVGCTVMCHSQTKSEGSGTG
jgi:hypothetical protein